MSKPATNEEQAVDETGAPRTWLARNFFKRRNVLGLTAAASRRVLTELDDYELVSVLGGGTAALEPRHRESLGHVIADTTLASRLSRTDITLFLAVRGAEVAGFVWAVAPRSRTVWHDRLPIRPGSALLFNGYVFGEHRRMGVFTKMMIAVQDHCLSAEGTSLVLGVVEASNRASFKALEALGYSKLGDNYLFKLFGVNVISLIAWRTGQPLEVHVVLKNEKGRAL